MKQERDYKAHSRLGDVEVRAMTSLAAQEKAHAILLARNPRHRMKRYEITVLLLRNPDNSPYIHTAVD